MIDFVKADISYLGQQSLLSNSLLFFIGKFDHKTGVVQEYPLLASYSSLEITIKSERFILLTGSLHKYWNALKTGVAHNYNDYTFGDFLETLYDLRNKFGIEPAQTTINNIEFGVNLVLPFSPEILLDRMISHRSKSFTSERQIGKHFRQCQRQRYFLKAYDKGLQYNQVANIFRFELKIVRMEHLNGITYLSDITHHSMSYMREMLVKNWNEILIWEAVKLPTNLPVFDRNLLLEGKNYTYWQELYDRVPVTYYKRLDKFRQLIKCYGVQKLQGTTHQLILDKCAQLFGATAGGLQKLTNLLDTGINQLPDVSIIDINSSSIELIPITDTVELRRYCKSCGRDITKQKPSSVYCSESLYGAAGKRCRNIATNPRNNLKRQITRYDNTNTLFDTNTLIVLSDYQKRLIGSF
jgi:hypothetical protein